MRPPATAPHLLVLADDLSGAAETCGALLPTTDRVRLLLAGRGAAPHASDPGDDPRGGDAAAQDDTAGHDVVVVDLDCRHAPGAVARAAAAGALVAQPSRRTVVKVDSLLRGRPGAVLAAVLAHPATAGAVVAPALPAAGRTTVGGVVHLHGVPLHETAAWAAEGGPAPTGVAAALAADGSGATTSLVTLDVVRSPALAAHLAQLVTSGLVAVCDAEDDDDLAAVARAAATLPGVALVGASALVAAVARELLAVPPTPAAPTPAVQPPTGEDGDGDDGSVTGLPDHPVLVVVGTAETGAAAQVAALRSAGAPTLALDVDALLDGGAGASADELAVLLAGGTAVVHLSAPAGVRPGAGRALVTALVAVAAAAVRRVEASGGPVDLVLTGGETARRVLDALGVDTLRPRAQVHLGAVVCEAPDGRQVATRPGSFGGADSLLAIARALHRGDPGPPLRHRVAAPPPPPPLPHDHHHERSPMTTTTSGTTPTPETAPADGGATPVIAVTMGDGAGVGPEVTVAAVIDPHLLTLCRPVVVGDAERLRQAVVIMGLDAEVVAVEHVDEAVFDGRRVNVIDLGLLPADLPWGEVSAIAGDAAFHYLRVATELAMAGTVQGICTAPLNKAALHAGGHLFPGHTELLAHFSGVEEVSMMLSTPRVKVIHVTTHLGLIDAIARIEPGLVERTVRRGHAAMLRSGVAEPRIGVCGINPHAGENGLFGYGEEAEKIEPALVRLRADGIDARGPLPADTAFFLAGRGDYDLIVAMYHDQGHGPVKVLGIEAGVNISVGLPVIRTSVDHGTAFDIAGTGAVDIRSMIEALRQAAAMSPRPSR